MSNKYPPAPADAAGNDLAWEYVDAGGCGQVISWKDAVDAIHDTEKTQPQVDDAISELAANGSVTLQNGDVLRMTTQQAAPQFDTTKFTGTVMDAVDDMGDDADPTQLAVGTEEITAKRRKREKPSNTALKLDLWSIHKGKRLAQDKEHAAHVKSKLVNEHSLADLHAITFEPFVDYAEVVADDETKVRADWLKELEQNTDFKALRAQTALDVLLSDIATLKVADQYVEYIQMVRKKQTPPTDLDRMKSAAKAAKNATQEVTDAVAIGGAFGLDPGNMTKQDPTQMLNLFKKLRSNRDLQKIVNLAGAYRRYAQARQRLKDHHGTDDVVGVELDGDIARLVASEISMMAVDEIMEMEVLRRIMERQAMCREHSGYKHVAKGPIIVCLDESGSMSGEPIQHAKALALSLAWVAKSQKRWCALVSWSSPGQYNYIALPPGKWDGMKVADWCCQFIGGGTQPPIDHMQQIYDATQAPIGKTDIIWISDGDAHVENSAAERFNQWRHEHKARSVTLLVNEHDAAFKKISDTVHKIKAISLEEEAIGEVLSL